ncbi:MAG: DUF1559 domain-containing protein [Planctomycetales bacterium]
MKRWSRAGFSLIELLVIIAVMAVLMTLLLPAIHAVRSRAQTSRCANNLTQVSLALHSYEGLYRVLPPGCVEPLGGPILNVNRGYQMGWLPQILPQMDQALAFRKIDFKVGAHHANNAPVADHSIEVLLCPSDWFARKPRPTSYAACHHEVEAPIDADNHGVMFLNSRIRMKDVSDGAGVTIFLGEKLRHQGDFSWMTGTRASLRNTGDPINAAFATGPPPNGMTPAPAPNVVGGFASFHGGGANMAFGDGGVRFVTDSIDLIVYRRLGHRDDGNLVGADALP